MGKMMVILTNAAGIAALIILGAKKMNHLNLRNNAVRHGGRIQ
jgi:hypothetical protein